MNFKELCESYLRKDSDVFDVMKSYYKGNDNITNQTLRDFKYDLRLLPHSGMLYYYKGLLQLNQGPRSSTTMRVKNILNECLPPIKNIRIMLNNRVNFVYNERVGYYREFTVEEISKFIDYDDLSQLWEYETNNKFTNLIYQLNRVSEASKLGPPVCLRLSDGNYIMQDGRHRTVIALKSNIKKIRMLVIDE